MARQPQRTTVAPDAAPDATLAYEPDQIYDVKLARAVKVGGATIRPLGVHQMTGAVLNDIIAREGADAVSAAEPR
jgi:hypothetical protein